MEMTLAHPVIAIDDASGIGEARRQAAALAGRLGFDSTALGQLSIAVTEIASNIVKHAKFGRVLIRVIAADEDVAGLEVTGMDEGPGIADVGESLRDGFSTAGSPGTGLGALRRLGTDFQLYSQAGKGTVARFESWSRATAPGRPATLREAIPRGAICDPMPGETACGDHWALVSQASRCALLVVDGLGHGPEAAVAAYAAVAVLQQAKSLDAGDLMRAVHAALRTTRGAAAAVAVLEPDRESCTFCGVGNIAFRIHAGRTCRNMVSHNGILGHKVRKFQVFSYPFPLGALCIAHSDGIAPRWDLDNYPGLSARHPSLVAGVLFRDYRRGGDDATVVVVRNQEQE
jgi:anti-sigma regulatory factor (Ser/Thr protein kinase)